MTYQRSILAWPELAGKRVGVWGFGREGSASLRKLRALGVESVLVDDNPPEKADTAGGAVADGILATADGGLDALLKCDVVIKTPGISRYRPEADRLREAGVVLTGGQPEPGRRGHWHQGQEHDIIGHRPPADRARSPGGGRRQHRERAV
jgi:UDP-N-acetylmuramoylalanine--D-glutamate ligase